jgi:hypothetical protein
MKMMTEITPAKMGRRMKKLETFMASCGLKVLDPDGWRQRLGLD